MVSKKRSTSTTDDRTLLERGFCVYRIPRHATQKQMFSNKLSKMISYLEWDFPLTGGSVPFRLFTELTTDVTALKGQVAIVEFFVFRKLRGPQSSEYIHLVRRRTTHNPTHRLLVLQVSKYEDAQTIIPLSAVPQASIVLLEPHQKLQSATIHSWRGQMKRVKQDKQNNSELPPNVVQFRR